MIKERTGSIDERHARSPRFLLCDTTGNTGGLPLSDEEWATSPIQCLDKAVDRQPGIIVVRFGQIPTKEREALVELSVTLKRNSHTRKCPLLALLHSKHRRLTEDLERAKVDYIRYVGDATLDSIRVRQIIGGLGPEDRPERRLKEICPFLHYNKIDLRHEMKVCGAYLDRMVLGGRRLHELCETEDHLRCEYYLNPRRRP